MNKCSWFVTSIKVSQLHKDNHSTHREVYTVQASAPAHQLAENEPPLSVASPAPEALALHWHGGLSLYKRELVADTLPAELQVSRAEKRQAVLELSSTPAQRQTPHQVPSPLLSE